MPGQRAGRARCARPLIAAALPGDQQQASAPHRHGRCGPHAWPADRTRTVRPLSDGCCAAWRSTAGVSSHTGTAAALLPGQLIGRARRACPLMAAALPADQLQAQLLHRHGRCGPHAWPACRTRTARPPSGCCAACRSAAGVSSHPGIAAAAFLPGQQIRRARCARPLAAALPADQLRVSALTPAQLQQPLMPGQQIRRARCSRPLRAAALPGDQLQAQLLHRHGRCSPPSCPFCRSPVVTPSNSALLFLAAFFSRKRGGILCNSPLVLGVLLHGRAQEKNIQ